MSKHAVFILSHGRADNVLTYTTLEKCGYTGDVYIIIDDEDETADQYRERFGDKVICFDKKAIADASDEGNNFDNRNVIVHARNACFDIARELGLDHFIQLDDDYYEIAYKYADTTGTPLIKDLNKVFEMMIAFYESTNCKAVAMAQNGDFIGGWNNEKQYRFNKRKCMNSFILSPKRQFTVVGINEDVNAYTLEGSRGNLFLTIPVIAINQKETQKQKGGMTGAYANGTYVKSFTTVTMQPSSVQVSMMNANHKRLHHSIDWKRTVPCIIREK
jgi:hypothetical protein